MAVTIEEIKRNHRVIELKCDTPYFQSVWIGSKKFDLRKNDRDYQVANVLLLKEYNPKHKQYTGRMIYASVEYLIFETRFGLRPGYIAMGIARAYTVDQFDEVTAYI